MKIRQRNSVNTFGARDQSYVIKVRPEFALRLERAVLREGPARTQLPRLRFPPALPPPAPRFRTTQPHCPRAGLEPTPAPEQPGVLGVLTVAFNRFDAYLLKRGMLRGSIVRELWANSVCLV